MPPLNVLLITDDQHRWDFYDARTVPELRTPCLDRLAREGLTLSHAFSNCPICMPTRFTWLYGLYASQAAQRLMGNAHDWPTRFPSAAHALQAAGYHTALIGKLHSLAGLYRRDITEHENVTRRRGFDDVWEVSGKSLSYWFDCRYTHYLRDRGLLDVYRRDVKRRCPQLGGRERLEPSPLEPDDHMDGVIGNRARDWLNGYAGDKPFFLHVSFCGPHFPLDPPEPYFSRYRPDAMPPPEGVDDPAAVRGWQEQRALYCGLIEHLDARLGALLEVLDRRGLARNTLVLFTTDHGDMMGHHNRSGKGLWYDTACRTPVIGRLPGVIPAGTVSPALVEAADLPATILEAAGVTPRIPAASLLPGSPARSYWNCLAGGAAEHRPWIYSELTGWRLCRDRDWKYVFRPDGDLLFDLENDPWEQRNLADAPAHAGRLPGLRRRLIASMSRSVAPDTDRGAGTRAEFD
ncbi:MAG: sulfatase-like hydrolase/transferase [Lentisphaerae bacterium]|nr:sulfatase-like hydrolase/transferase [Lentisphaerota bacterium]